MKRHLLLPVVRLIVLVVIVMFYFNQSTDKNNSRDLQNFAISQYLAFKNGSDKTIESVHKQVKGNKPVDLFIFNKLNEYTLGQLLCIYEYKTLFEASFSDINPFDQYGVELGKQIFKNL